MLKENERREMLKSKVWDILKETKTLLKEKKALCEEWETRCHEAEMELITCEDLIFFYDTPEMSKRLAKAYNRERHYDYIYHKLAHECDELEEVLYGLEKADYWL